jgi:hypothetical protein
MDYTSADVEGKRVCLFVGDSNAAASGIPDYRDGMGPVLATHLGDEWVVPIVAQGGWGTKAELQGLSDYPHEPDLVVLQYFLNDITESAVTFGKSPVPPIEIPTGVMGFVSRHSFLFDRLYWRVYRARMMERGGAFWANLEAAYADPKIWEDHRKSILSFIQYTQERDIPMLAVLLPSVTNAELNQSIIAKVGGVFTSQDVPVLDLMEPLSTWRAEDIVISPVNGHPNAAVDKEIGRWIYESLRGHKLIEAN